MSAEPRCTLCNGLAVFVPEEQAWRHAGKPHQREYLEQGFCNKYGYPIQVQPEIELTRLRAEVERLQVQLAGCGAAALGATKDPATKGEYGWSPAYQDVLNLRLEVESLRRSNEGFETHLEFLQRANESLRKQIAEQGWQPIESAPKDGTCLILATLSGIASWPGFWDQGEHNYWGYSGWYDEMDRGNILTAEPYEATHWRPLPDPPIDQATEKAE